MSHQAPERSAVAAAVGVAAAAGDVAAGDAAAVDDGDNCAGVAGAVGVAVGTMAVARLYMAELWGDSADTRAADVE